MLVIKLCTDSHRRNFLCFCVHVYLLCLKYTIQVYATYTAHQCPLSHNIEPLKIMFVLNASEDPMLVLCGLLSYVLILTDIIFCVHVYLLRL